jgi:hypothetical protein
MRTQTILSAFFAAALPLTGSAVETCPPDLNGACPPNTVGKYCPVAHAPACPVGKMTIIVPIDQPPPPEHTQVVCDYTSGRYYCEAWPQKAGLSYIWTKLGNLTFVAPPYLDEFAEVTCTPGPNNRITVTVGSPYGYSTAVTAYLYCGYAGEY